MRAAFYRATAPQRATGFETVQQCLHLPSTISTFPIGIEHPEGECRHSERHSVDLGYRPDQPPDLLQDRLQQYDPLYRPRGVDFGKTAYQSHPLDRNREQPVQQIAIPE